MIFFVYAGAIVYSFQADSKQHYLDYVVQPTQSEMHFLYEQISLIMYHQQPDISTLYSTSIQLQLDTQALTA